MEDFYPQTYSEKYLPRWQIEVMAQEYHYVTDNVSEMLNFIRTENTDHEMSTISDEKEAKIEEEVYSDKVKDVDMEPISLDSPDEIETFDEIDFNDKVNEILMDCPDNSEETTMVQPTANQRWTCVRKIIEKVMNIYEPSLKDHSRKTKIPSELRIKDQELIRDFYKKTASEFGDTLTQAQMEDLFATVVKLHIRGGSKNEANEKFTRIIRAFNPCLSETAVEVLYSKAEQFKQ